MTYERRVRGRAVVAVAAASAALGAPLGAQARPAMDVPVGGAAAGVAQTPPAQDVPGMRRIPLVPVYASDPGPLSEPAAPVQGTRRDPAEFPWPIAAVAAFALLAALAVHHARAVRGGGPGRPAGVGH